MTEPHDTTSQDYDFRFRIGAAIADQVAQHLFKLTPIPLANLTQANAGKPGIYQLFLDGSSVYIGQTVKTVFDRVGGTHRAKIRGKLDPSCRRLDDMRVTVRFVLIDDLTVIQISETALIETMKRFALLTAAGASDIPVGSAAAAAAAVTAASGALPAADAVDLTLWNRTGFGSNVPGYGRRNQAPAVWSTEYPADLSFPVSAGATEPMTAEGLIRQLTIGAPLWLAIPDSKIAAFRADHPGSFNLAPAIRAFDDWLMLLEQGMAGGPRVLAGGWRVDRSHPQTFYIDNV